jgi:outer membrane murein-binding lipoprotein Lpp
MNISDWTAVISATLGLLTFIWAIHRFTTKAMVKDYLSELKPNGGSSMKDKVNDIDTKVKRLETRVDQIYFLIVSDKNAK